MDDEEFDEVMDDEEFDAIEDDMFGADEHDDALAAKEELELRFMQGLDEPVDPADRDVPAEQIALDRIPRRLWEQTLAPYHRSQRGQLVRQMSDEGLQELAWELTFEMDMAEQEGVIAREREQAAARRRGAPLPVPGADHRAVAPTVQINTRLRPDDHARLREAAAAVGLRPTTLARALMLNGVAMILSEHPERAADS